MSLKEFWEMLEIKGKGEKTKQNPPTFNQNIPEDIFFEVLCQQVTLTQHCILFLPSLAGEF